MLVRDLEPGMVFKMKNDSSVFLTIRRYVWNSTIRIHVVVLGTWNRSELIDMEFKYRRLLSSYVTKKVEYLFDSEFTIGDPYEPSSNPKISPRSNSNS